MKVKMGSIEIIQTEGEKKDLKNTSHFFSWPSLTHWPSLTQCALVEYSAPVTALA